MGSISQTVLDSHKSSAKINYLCACMSVCVRARVCMFVVIKLNLLKRDECNVRLVTNGLPIRERDRYQPRYPIQYISIVPNLIRQITYVWRQNHNTQTYVSYRLSNIQSVLTINVHLANDVWNFRLHFFVRKSKILFLWTSDNFLVLIKFHKVH